MEWPTCSSRIIASIALAEKSVMAATLHFKSMAPSTQRHDNQLYTDHHAKNKCTVPSPSRGGHP